MVLLGRIIIYGLCLIYSIVGASAVGMYFAKNYQHIKISTKSRYYFYKSLIVGFAIVLLLAIGVFVIYIFFERYPQED